MSPGPTVVLVDSDFLDCTLERDAIEAAGLNFVDARAHDPGAKTAAVRAATGLLVQYERIGRELIASSPSLSVIVAYGVGSDMIDVDAARDHGVEVRPIADYCIDEVADHAMALVLASLRRIVDLSAAVRAGGWPLGEHVGDLRTLAGRRFAVVGYGSIGRAVLQRAAAFRAIPVAHDPFVAGSVMRASGVEPVSLADAFRCDVVSLHLPLNDSTRGLVSSELLGLLPAGALLVNVARGGVVDEPALRKELDSGRISAALDVLTCEPPEPSDVVVGAPNAIITPHAAWYSRQALTLLRERAAAEVVAALCSATASPGQSATSPHWAAEGVTHDTRR